MTARRPPKNQLGDSNRGGWWLELVNATLRDLLPERIEVRIKPAKRPKAKRQKSGKS